MMSYASMRTAIAKSRDPYAGKPEEYPVMIRLADGRLLPVRAADVQPNPKTGEISIVLDTRDSV